MNNTDDESDESAPAGHNGRVAAAAAVAGSVGGMRRKDEGVVKQVYLAASSHSAMRLPLPESGRRV